MQSLLKRVWSRDQASFVKYMFSRMYALASLLSQLKCRWSSHRRAAIGERLNSIALLHILFARGGAERLGHRALFRHSIRWAPDSASPVGACPPVCRSSQSGRDALDAANRISVASRPSRRVPSILTNRAPA